MVKASRATHSLRGICAWCFLVWVSPVQARFLEDFTKFEEVTHTVYDEQSGRPQLVFHYNKVSKVYPRFKFLQFSLPNFVIEGLELKFDLTTYRHGYVMEKLRFYEKKEAVRFVRASNVRFSFFDVNGVSKLNAEVLRLAKDGRFELQKARWLPDKGDPVSCDAMFLEFAPGQSGLMLDSQSGQTTSLVIRYQSE